MAIPDGDFACGDAKCSKRAAFNPFAPYPTFANAALGKLRGARPSAFADGRMGAAAKPPPAVFGEAEYGAPRVGGIAIYFQEILLSPTVSTKTYASCTPQRHASP